MADRYDFDGYEVVTSALRELLNEYPAIDEKIAFSKLADDGGVAMFPTTGSVIQSERESITGHVTQVCLYPFYIVYRVAGLSENNKANVKEWLDSLGKWLEKQPIQVRGEEYKLAEYPTLTGNRKFLDIARTSPSYLESVNENKSENWVVRINASYQNEFDR